MVKEVASRGYARGAGSYRSGRPTYPRTIIDDLVRRTAGARVVELGAGTGILTAELVIRGSDVVAVEPVKAMRQALIQDVGEANVREGRRGHTCQDRLCWCRHCSPVLPVT